MPSPLPPTQDVTPQINRLRNMIRIRSRDKMTFHLTVGNKNMDIKALTENIDTVVTKLEQTLKDGKRSEVSLCQDYHGASGKGDLEWHQRYAELPIYPSGR